MHTRPLTRRPQPGATNLIESAILLLLTIFFRDTAYYEPVFQNLSKFYEKTP